MYNIYNKSDEFLETELERIVALDEPTSNEWRRAERIEHELEYRAIARCGDDRVLQGLGISNYSEA